MSSRRVGRVGAGGPVARRSAFTLVEVLAAIALFLVVATAMLGILFAATNVYRDGEASRQANDEAIAGLAAIDDDLRQLLPVSQGGFFYSGIGPPGLDAAGSQVLAFVIANPDPQDLDPTGSKAQLLVAYWVDQASGSLVRSQVPRPPSASVYPLLQGLMAGTPDRLAHGCLFLGIQADAPDLSRGDLSWSGSDGQSDRCTEAVAGQGASPMPNAIRLTVVFTGQVDVSQGVTPRGFVVHDDGDRIQVGGVRQLPVTNGPHFFRLGDPDPSRREPGQAGPEWIQADSVAGGQLTWRQGVPGVGQDDWRGMRHTQRATHQRGEPLVWGTSYRLVRRLLP